jgi:hypothetical protein
MIVVGSSADGPRWRKSKYSTGNGECVEVGSGQGAVAVRDSTCPNGPALCYPTRTWQSFLADAKLGDFDVRKP